MPLKKRQEHRIKVSTYDWDRMKDGKLPFVFRKDDRGFELNDLILPYVQDKDIDFNGFPLSFRIVSLLRGTGENGMDKGYVIIGLRREWRPKGETKKGRPF